MGRLKKQLQQIVEAEDGREMKDFSVKVVEPDGKFWFGSVKAKNQESAISQMADGLGAKSKTLSFQVV